MSIRQVKFKLIMSQLETIAKNIEKIRQEKSITVDKLCKLADIPMSTLMKIRMKKYNDIKVSTLSAIAKALNCTLDELTKE